MDNNTNKKDKSTLSSFIQKVIKDMAYNKKFKNDLLNFTKDRIPVGKTNTILNSRKDDISFLNDNDVYWYAKFLINGFSQYET